MESDRVEVSMVVIAGAFAPGPGIYAAFGSGGDRA